MSAPSNIVDKTSRWRWWYEAIADWMIANPSGKLGECAAALNKSPAYLSMIVNSDMYKEYYAKRKAEWRERHDHAIVTKTTKIAELGLDLILERMEAKRDAVPLGTLKDVTDSALARLGYGTPAAGVPAPSHVTNIVQVTAQDLAEARALVRNGETMKLIEQPPQTPTPPSHVLDSPKERDEESANAASS